MVLKQCKKEYTILFAAATCVAEMLGGGVISLPYVVYETYWVIGGLLIIFGTILTSYTGHLLSQLYLDICASDSINKPENQHTSLLVSIKSNTTKNETQHEPALTEIDDFDNDSSNLAPISNTKIINNNKKYYDNDNNNNNNNNNDHTGLTPDFREIGFGGRRLSSIDSVLIQEELNSPYIEIGKRIFPQYGELLLTICVGITLLFVDIVFLVLCGMNLESLLGDNNNFLSNITNENGIFTIQTICIMFFALITLIFSYFWYKVHDYQLFVWLAVLSSFLAIIMAFPLVIEYAPSKNEITQLSIKDVKLSNFIEAFGTIMFAFGGHAGFPTYQKNMGIKYQKYFGYSINISYIYIFIMMFTFSIVISLLYGNDINENVLNSLPDNNIFSKIIIILITFHMFSATSTLVPPVCAIISKIFGKMQICYMNYRDNKYNSSGYTRRSIDYNHNNMYDNMNENGNEIDVEIVHWWTPIAVQFIAAVMAILLQDNFLTIMGILGNTTITLCTFVMPCLLYVVHFKNRISMISKIICISGVIAGTAIGIISVGSNIYDFVNS